MRPELNELWFTLEPLPDNVRELLERGELSRAEDEIRRLLPSCGGARKVRLEFELDRIARWRFEFPYGLEEGFRELQKTIPDLRFEEMGELLARGCLDHALLDGEVRLLRRFVPNAFWLCPELKQRRKRGRDERGWAARIALKERVQRVVEAARRTGGGYVLPLKYRVRAEVVVKPGAAPVGSTLRVWIPLPRVSGLHPEVRVLKAEPQPERIAPEEHPQRTAYFELEQGREGARCFIEYEFVARGFHVEVDPREAYLDEGSEVCEAYTRERPPHIVFTPYLRELASRIVGGEENPYLKARRIWDWVTENVRYTYARDYALYDCIAEYVARERRGDCGMQAILFITLCRIAGVPARWESAWYMNPVSWGMHDWAQFYVEPYGWLYADPSFGGARHGEEWRRSFYFGGIEGYRLAANIEISHPFDPPKKHFRSDPVDSQRGEVEYEEGNLYYDKWDFKLEVLEVESLEEPVD
ncbi:MAG: transglutaminase-like domain-containing protein [Thermofilaceae archaeon]